MVVERDDRVRDRAVRPAGRRARRRGAHALHRALDSGDGDLVVDLAGVDVVDAAGLGVLLGADRRAKLTAGGSCCATPRPGPRILRVTRLHRVLTLDEPLARRRLSPPTAG